jgi:hypothetical protein
MRDYDDCQDAQAPGSLTRLRESSFTAQAEALQLRHLVRADSEEDPLKSSTILRSSACAVSRLPRPRLRFPTSGDEPLTP